MKLELRETKETQDGPVIPRGLVCIAETPEESRILDAVFGDRVDGDGLIGKHLAECRLSDGYGDHYIYVHAKTEWRAMVNAPLDGTEVELLVRHHSYFLELKTSGKELAEKLWQETVRAAWIDHHGGGWTWHGLNGSPIGWRPIA